MTPEENSYSGDVIIPPYVIYDGTIYSVTRIDEYSFYKCPNLISVEIPNSVTEVEDWAFSHCTSLVSVRLSRSLKNIGKGMFYKCTSLVAIDIPASVEHIDVQAFMNCTSLTSINISNSVSTIGYQAFKNCSGLTSVTIGKGLSSIAEEAFWGCDKLASVTILATTPPKSAIDEAFSCYGVLHVRMESKEAYRNSLYWNNFDIKDDADAGVLDYTYKPMIQKGKVWNFEITHTYTKEKVELVRNYTLTINENMGEGGWFKVYKTFENEGFEGEFYQEDSYYWVGEKDKVVSETYKNTDSPNPLIDFSLHKGDQCVVDYDYYYRIVDKDYIRVKGHTYRRLHIDVNQDGIADDYWVEGIGTKNYSHITPFMKLTGGRFWYDTPRLLSVYKEGICIFGRADFDTPGMTSGIEKNACNSAKQIYGIYNLLGCRLTSAPRKGIYIKNGRKMITK